MINHEAIRILQTAMQNRIGKNGSAPSQTHQTVPPEVAPTRAVAVRQGGALVVRADEETKDPNKNTVQATIRFGETDATKKIASTRPGLIGGEKTPKAIITRL